MPIRNDYFVKMIAQLTQARQEIREMQRAERYEEGLARLSSEMRARAGLDIDLLHRLPTRELVALLSSAGRLHVERAVYVAELLELEADVRAQAGRPLPVAERVKALELYARVLAEAPELGATYGGTLVRVRSELQGVPLDAPTLLALVDAFEGMGAFDRAEDALFEALEVPVASVQGGEDPEDVRRRGARLYASLAARSDEELEAGGLPRAEVEEGRRAFEALA